MMYNSPPSPSTIADKLKMGLGKTIQTLALILTHPRPRDPDDEYPRSTAKCCWGTLLVVPLALADQWRREIVEKTNLRPHVHHGPKRERDPSKLAKWDVVITTYDTVSSEWAQRMTSEETNEVKGGCVFRVNWWRVVLGIPHLSHSRSLTLTPFTDDAD